VITNIIRMAIYAPQGVLCNSGINNSNQKINNRRLSNIRRQLKKGRTFVRPCLDTGT
jgi:hypothetical protein